MKKVLHTQIHMCAVGHVCACGSWRGPECAHEADDADGHGDGAAKGDEGHGDDEEVEHAPARGKSKEGDGGRTMDGDGVCSC